MPRHPSPQPAEEILFYEPFQRKMQNFGQKFYTAEKDVPQKLQ